MVGWFKFHRELLDKPIWTNSTPEQKTVLMTLMSMVGYEENEWEWKGDKYKTKPGQVVTSLPSIANKCGKGISIQNVRSSLKRFEKLEFLTDESTNKNRLITIVNWGFYQGSDDKPTDDPTGNQQATNRQPTAIKKERTKEVKKESKEIKSELPFERIVDYLNRKANKSYKHTTPKTRAFIEARFNEGFTAEDFKKVIDIKTAEWINTDDEKYVRPETLFGTKFESYLNQKPATGIIRNSSANNKPRSFREIAAAQGGN